MDYFSWSISAEYLNPTISDHCPILIECIPEVSRGGRPFKFFNHLADRKDFISLVESCWSTTVHGTTIYRVWSKLKLVKAKLKNLHKQVFQGIQTKINLAKAHLYDVQSHLQHDYDDITLLQQEHQDVNELKRWLKVEESALKQKSRIQWLANGDSNHELSSLMCKRGPD